LCFSQVAPACRATPARTDPYESTNRAIFQFNKRFDDNVALPIARSYRNVVPEPIRIGIHNFLVNIRLPVTFGND
jgi:phospholipid-binding lipoprotein MlaA